MVSQSTMVATVLALSQLALVTSQSYGGQTEYGGGQVEYGGGDGQCDICALNGGGKPRLFSLTMRYSGSTPTTVSVSNVGNFRASPGGSFTITSSYKLPTNTVFTANGQSSTLHTSCSQPIYLGQSVGGFLSIAGFRTDTSSDADCAAVVAPPPYAPDCYASYADCPIDPYARKSKDKHKTTYTSDNGNAGGDGGYVADNGDGGYVADNGGGYTDNGVTYYGAPPPPPCKLCCYPTLADCPGPIAGETCDACAVYGGRPTSLTFTITGGAPGGQGAYQGSRGGSTGSVIASTGPYMAFCQNAFGQVHGDQLVLTNIASNDVMCSVSSQGGPSQQVNIHVSCSQRLVTGDQFGAIRLDGFVDSGNTPSAPRCGPQEAPECELCCDMNPPVITSSYVDATYEGDGAGNVNDIYNWINSFTCSDGETDATLSYSPNPLQWQGPPCNRKAVVNYTCIDDCGNGHSVIGTIRIIDTEPPIISISAKDGQGECNGGSKPAELQAWLDDFGGMRAEDVCHGSCDDSYKSYRYDGGYIEGDNCNCPSSQNDLPACALGKTYRNLCFAICNYPGVSFKKLKYSAGPCGTTPTTEAPYNPQVGGGNTDYFGDYLAQNGGGGAGYNALGQGGGGGYAHPTPPPTCGPVCAIFCPHGNVLDSLGCPTCTCKSATIVEVMMSRPDDFSTFLKALGNVNLLDFLKAPGPFTVFAPNNAAFMQLAYGTAQAIFTNPAALKQLLQYHIVMGKHLSSSFTNGQRLTTIAGVKLVIHIAGGSVHVLNNNGNIVATIVEADILATNGVVHIIDTVLMPAHEPTPSCNNVTLSHSYPEFHSCGGGGVYSNQAECMQCADVVFTATDPLGNKVSQTKTFRVTDTTPPTISEPTSPVVECDKNTEDRFQRWLKTHGGAHANDDCSGVTWSTAPANPTLPPLCNGVVSVTFIATDGCGRASSASASFTVSDTRAPEVVRDPTPLLVGCTQYDPLKNPAYLNWIKNNAGMQVKDICPHGQDCTQGYVQSNQAETDNYKCTNCNGAMGYVGEVCLDGNKEYENMCYLWCHNGPVTDQSRWTAGKCNFYEVPGHCSDGITWTHTSTPLGPCAGDYDNNAKCSSVTFTAVDSCGNKVTRTTEFRISDNTAPVLVRPAQGGITDSEFTLPGDLQTWLDNNGGAQATEDCCDITWTYVKIKDFAPVDPSVSKCPEEALFEFIATDCHGNAVRTRATFRIRDTDAPSVTSQGEDLVYACDASCGVGPPPPPPATNCDACGNGGQPQSLTFTITGGVATGEGSMQGGKGGAAGTPISSGPYNAFCQYGFGQLNGDQLVVSGFGGNDVTCTVSGGGGIQQIQIHVSCSERLVTGDQFGAIRLDSFVDSTGSSACGGGYNAYNPYDPYGRKSKDKDKKVTTYTSNNDNNGGYVADNTDNGYNAETLAFYQVVAYADVSADWEQRAQSLLATWLENQGCLHATDCNAVTWSYTGAPVGELCGQQGSVTFTASDKFGHSTTRVLSYDFRKKTSVQDCPICSSAYGAQKAKISSLTFRYDGSFATTIAVTDIGQYNAQPGGTFTITSSTKLPTNTVFRINGQSTTLHTSCSQPLSVGMSIGGVLTIVGFVTDISDSATSCPAPECTIPDVCGIEAPTVPPTTPPPTACTPNPLDACPYNAKPTSLSFKYIVGSTHVTNAQGGEATVSGGGITGSASFLCSGTTLISNPIAPGGSFTIMPAYGGNFDAQTLCTVTGAGGSQTVGFHTSCSQPLRIGDVFGSMQLIGFNGIQDQCLLQNPTPMPTPMPTPRPTVYTPVGGGGGNGDGEGGGNGNGDGGVDVEYDGDRDGESICQGDKNTKITSIKFMYNGLVSQNVYHRSQNPLTQPPRKPYKRSVKLVVASKKFNALEYGKLSARLKQGEMVTVYGKVGAKGDSTGIFGKTIKMKVSGGVIRFTTSCSKADLRIGDQFGPLKVVDYTTTEYAGTMTMSNSHGTSGDSNSGSSTVAVAVIGTVVALLVVVAAVVHFKKPCGDTSTRRSSMAASSILEESKKHDETRSLAHTESTLQFDEDQSGTHASA
eukprot:m.237562 g.237562  ORF g.237562 m.237562 type:complete len:2040 (-) comp33710_c1_seq2:30-6149(-)